jgi:hypothetical protein
LVVDAWVYGFTLRGKLRFKGYRFFFFSNEGNEPIHIHVEKAGNYAKFWLYPIKIAIDLGFHRKELKVIFSITEDMLYVLLLDGREIGVPLIWFPKLRQANKKQLENWRFIGKGIGIHWEELDEDLSVSALLNT